MSDGTAPTVWSAWDTATVSNRDRYSEMYMQVWVKFVGPNNTWTGHPAVHQLFRHQVGGPTAGDDDGSWGLYDTAGSCGAPTTATSFPAYMSNSGSSAGTPVVTQQNQTATKYLTVGTWHKVEIVRSIGTPDTADGRSRMWIDGTLVHDRTEQYVATGYEEGFYGIQFNPIWGGQCAPAIARPQTDYLLLNYLYVSGIPQTISNPPSSFPGTDYPNQPGGFTSVREFDGSTVTGTQLDGKTYTYTPFSGTLTTGTDATAPHSPNTLVRGTWPAGMSAGTEPFSWSLGTWPEQKQLYMCFDLRLNANSGGGFELENALDKFLGFVGGAEDPNTGAQNSFILGLPGQTTGTNTNPTNFRVAVFQQNGINARYETLNGGSAPRLLTVGAWHKVEFLLQMNDVGVANGRVRIWVDDTPEVDVQNLTMRTSAIPHGFYSWKWRPTFGGRNGAKLYTDTLDIDHGYISGIAL